tara:strand:- start:1081 stop:2451 length:1371 start_codon:yes stop_codon:yes gene_type:complete
MDSDGGSIPNLISLSQIPTNMETKLETDLLEPVVFTQGGPAADGFCRFTLQNKGFLHSHSKLFLSAVPGAGVSSAYFAPNVGIGQMIKKAVLKIGNKTLNEITSWDKLFAIKSALIKNENNKEREQFTTGRFMANQFLYDEGSDVKSADYGLDNGLEYEKTTGTNLQVPTWAESSNGAPSECPTFSVDLSDLFPFLKVNQLPLYMINEPINIELTFHPTLGYRTQIASTDTAAQETLITRSDIKFCADYVYYGMNDEMTQFANANRDMSFSFVDYRSSDMTVDATSLGTGVIRNVGMANRVVNRLLTSVTDSGLGEGTILNEQNGLAPVLNVGVPGTISYNVRYNDRFEFTSNVSNTARLFSILTDSEGVPFLTRDQYSFQKNLITADTLQGRAQNNIAGKFFYLGTKLTNGRVGNRGLEVHLTGQYPAEADLMTTFAEYLRVASLKDGMFEIFNA